MTGGYSIAEAIRMSDIEKYINILKEYSRGRNLCYEETNLIALLSMKGLRTLKENGILKPFKMSSPRQHYITTPLFKNF